MQRRERLRATIALVKRGEAVGGVGVGGEPPALLTATSSRPWRSTTASTSAATGRGRARRRRGSRAARGTRRGLVAPAHHDAWPRRRAKRSVMPRPMPLVPPVTSTTRPVRSMVEWSSTGASCGLRCHGDLTGRQKRSSGGTVGITTSIDDRGIAEVVMDNPPVNALTVAGLVRAGRHRPRPRRRPRRAGRRAARRGPGLQRRRRHQGDAGDRGLRRPRSAPTAAATPPSPPSTSARCR